jgi:hypothetical protein
MRSPAIILVTDTIPMDAEKKGEGAHERLQEQRVRTNLGHGNGNSSWPSVAHLWAGKDLCRVGMPDPSVDLQPDNSVLDTRSLNAPSQTQTSVRTVATLRRLTNPAMSLSRCSGRIPTGNKCAPC